MPKVNAYEAGLDKNAANYTPLSPLSLLARSAYVYPSRVAVIHGARRLAWSEVYARCRKLASALRKAGVVAGDTVATMLPNVPAMFEAHFGVAMAGAVVNTLNTRLDAEAIAFMLEHAETKVLLTDREFSPTVAKALALTARKLLVIDVDDAYTGVVVEQISLRKGEFAAHVVNRSYEIARYATEVAPRQIRTMLIRKTDLRASGTRFHDLVFEYDAFISFLIYGYFFNPCLVLFKTQAFT